MAVWQQNQPDPGDPLDDVWAETEEEMECEYEQLVALRRSQISKESRPGELQEIDLFRLQRVGRDSAPVRFNISLTVPEESRNEGHRGHHRCDRTWKCRAGHFTSGQFWRSGWLGAPTGTRPTRS